MRTNLEAILIERLNIAPSEIQSFCQRWQITELSLFGSVLREDFHPDRSDVDVLITFAPQARQGLSEMLQIKEELEQLFQRKVDCIVKESIEQRQNWIRKRNILDSAQVIYAS
ncbi:nucleotidyltransferase family protein [Leptolyngbya sp. AN03gr2]|uniref:nucleotidyltransferase family protein n=1 Tax=unclassified Leptolyngbya TaxID=2650499 RepID=UPI003D31F73B